MAPDTRGRNVSMDDEMWAAVVEAAAHETLDTGRQVSASEWVRRAISERLSAPPRSPQQPLAGTGSPSVLACKPES